MFCLCQYCLASSVCLTCRIFQLTVPLWERTWCLKNSDTPEETKRTFSSTCCIWQKCFENFLRCTVEKKCQFDQIICVFALGSSSSFADGCHHQQQHAAFRNLFFSPCIQVVGGGGKKSMFGEERAFASSTFPFPVSHFCWFVWKPWRLFWGADSGLRLESLSFEESYYRLYAKRCLSYETVEEEDLSFHRHEEKKERKTLFSYQNYCELLWGAHQWLQSTQDSLHERKTCAPKITFFY